ncbi:MAG: hypothetical protein ACC667_08645 [Longimicrobiales bacterium]
MRIRRLGLTAALTLAVGLGMYLLQRGGGEKSLEWGVPGLPGIALPQLDVLTGTQGDVWSAAFAAQDGLNSSILEADGVVGTAIGLGLNGLPVVKVYLENPSVTWLPTSYEGVGVVPEVLGEIWALGQGPMDAPEGLLDPKTRFPRPVPIGVSTGQADVTAGTIGARATDGSKIFALSNNHVFANSNNAKIGDNVLQPGRVDGGSNPDHSIGTLQDFEPIRFCSALLCPNNELDAAIAITTAEKLGTATPENGYGKPRSTTVKGSLNMKVQKYGRTTGYTHGTITGIRATITVNYRTGKARFVNQLVITGKGTFSQGGDSGSLIVSEAPGNLDRQPVGLLFAGSANSTIANPIDPVLQRFGITIDGS